MIKTLIFDFGDVFINLDKPATAREMAKHNIKSFGDAIIATNEQLEQGFITSQEFQDAYTKVFPHIEGYNVITSWNAILLDFPTYRLDFIKDLASKNMYKLILLSNTNEIHIDWIKERLSFYEEFKNCFDVFYLSHEIGLRKPNADIYEFVLRENNLKPEECLFIDDTKANTDTAEKLGIHTWNIDPVTEDIVDLFTIKENLF